MTDFLIVGAGFYGSVLAERIANKLNKTVLIIDKRSHIGGNCYTTIEKKTGIEYHKYGTHIFHTSNKYVWDYINQFTTFNNYRHQVLTKFNNKTYQMPINLETINSLYNKDFNPEECKQFIKRIIKKYDNKTPNNFEEKAISLIGKKLYSAFIKDYTYKQWGKEPKLLPANILSRLPIRFNYNEDYFNHCKWQGIPTNGYTKIFNELLKNKRIKVKLNTSYRDINLEPKIATIYTGALDELFDYKFGLLEWRSVFFEKKILNIEDFQGTSVMNYAERKVAYTRIHEPRHLHPERNYKKNKTLLIYEYSKKDIKNPFYPVNDTKNRKIHRKYKQLCKKNKNFLTGGRLGDYAYYDMDMTISAALKKFDYIKKNFKI